MNRRPGAAAPRTTIAGAAFSVAIWLLGLIVIATALIVLGRGRLSTPPIGSGADLARWLDGRTTIEAAFALLRIGALGVVAYQLALTLLAGFARLLRLPGLLRAVEVSSLPGARRAISAVAGIGLGATTTLVAMSPGVGAPPRVPAPTASPEHAGGPSSDGRLAIAHVELRPAIVEAIPLPSRTWPATPTIASHSPAPRSSLPPLPNPEPPAPAPTWTVRPGDHLWSIAEAHLCASWSRPVTSGEIDPYWRVLTERNRAGLPDPANPDLLFAGHVLALPAVPADPRLRPEVTEPVHDAPARPPHGERVPAATAKDPGRQAGEDPSPPGVADQHADADRTGAGQVREGEPHGERTMHGRPEPPSSRGETDLPPAPRTGRVDDEPPTVRADDRPTPADLQGPRARAEPVVPTPRIESTGRADDAQPTVRPDRTGADHHTPVDEPTVRAAPDRRAEHEVIIEEVGPDEPGDG